MGENDTSYSRLWALAFHHLDHVIDDLTVLMLRTEHYNIRICINLYIVSGWPVKQIIRVDSLLRSICVGSGELAAQDKTPVGALAQIPFQALKQWGCIDSCRETEVLATDLA
jgi:hypothetical protein